MLQEVVLPAAAVPMKKYGRRMQQQIGMCIQEITAPLLQRCSQLAAAGEDTDKRTSEILDDAHNFVAQLADIYDFVSPCFPEKYRIFHVIWKQYHEHLAFMLDCIGACAEQLANADILKVMFVPTLLSCGLLHAAHSTWVKHILKVKVSCALNRHLAYGLLQATHLA